MKKGIKIFFIVFAFFVIVVLADTIQAKRFNNRPLTKITENANGGEEDLSQFIYVDKDIKIIDEGLITNINRQSITIKDKETDYSYEIAIDEHTQFINDRTTETMKLDDIKIGDYYNAGRIIRNITGEEWKKECIKNLAYCCEEGGNLLCNPQKITNIENKGNYVIITLIMEDTATEYINGKDNIQTFEFKLLLIQI